VSHKRARRAGTEPIDEKRIGKAQNANSVCGFVCATTIAVLTVALGWILRACHAAYMQTVPSALIVLDPSAGIWFLYAFPVALGAGFLLIDPMMEVYVGAPLSHPSMSVYIQNPRWIQIISVFVVCLFVPIAASGVRKHVRFTESGIADQRALAWREHYYAYSEVQDVALAYYWINGTKSSRGHASSSPGVFVFLKDGTRWSPRDAELPTTKSQEIATLISERAGRQIVMPDTVIDSPVGGSGRSGPIVLLAYGAMMWALIWAVGRLAR
jgi:hypothetical protein